MTAGKLLFGVYLENERELVLRDSDGVEERRVVIAATTLKLFSAEEVASDLRQSLSYEMQDAQGSEDARR